MAKYYQIVLQNMLAHAVLIYDETPANENTLFYIKNMEPHKCEEWVWMSWDEFRQIPKEELFLPMQHLLERSTLELETGLGINL